MTGAVVLLMGRSFSGKSTAARALEQALTAPLISCDALNEERGLRGGRGVPVEEWSRTNEVAHQRARPLLAQDATVVIDDTSSPRFLRDAWRALAGESHSRFVLVFIDVSPETIRERVVDNRARAARSDVLDEVMAAHLDAFEPPEDDEPHIRFDETATAGSVVAGVQRALDA